MLVFRLITFLIFYVQSCWGFSDRRSLSVNNNPPIFDECVAASSPNEGSFDVLYVVHSKDIGVLKWGIRSLICRMRGVGRVWVVSNDSPSVHKLLEEVETELGSEDRIRWHDEKSFPFSWNDIDNYMKCGKNCGWYLQQLLKLYAGRAILDIRDYLVVDADLVWFEKDIEMVAEYGESGLPVSYYYNTALQNHAAYFQFIDRLTKGSVKRQDRSISGVSHHMLFKRDVLAALMTLIENLSNLELWKAILASVDSSLENSVSEYELYFNYALKYHPDTIKLRHLTFANGPRPGLVYNGGDESKTSSSVWVHESKNGLAKQMTLDYQSGIQYVGYHSYARKRYYDFPENSLSLYCDLGIAKRNSDLAKKCDGSHPTSRRLLESPDPHILNNCTAQTSPTEKGSFDVLYVVHSKDIGVLKWGIRSLICRMRGVGRVWVVSNDSPSVRKLLEEVETELGSEDRIRWHDEKSFPFSWNDIDNYMKCGKNCGWYLQQLLKLYAGRAIPDIRDYLVVDADLVWFGDITMVARVGADGTPSAYYYNTASQNHRAYFDHMSKLTHGKVGREHKALSGVVHHMVFKLDVLEALMKMCEEFGTGEIFWKVLLKSVDPKAYNSVSEYELYFNYALKYHPDTIKLRHLTFANGPRPGLLSNGGDESSMRGVWGVTGHAFEKLLALDQRMGYDYVGYHSYAKRRYYDIPDEEVYRYCRLGVRGERNSEMEKRCDRFDKLHRWR